MGDHPVISYFFILANVGIFVGYMFMALCVVPRLESLKMARTKIGAFGFFFLGGVTHLDMTVHALFFSEKRYAAMVAEPQTLFVVVPLAVCAWLFVTGLYVELTHWGPWGVREAAPAPDLDTDELSSIPIPERDNDS